MPFNKQLITRSTSRINFVLFLLLIISLSSCIGRKDTDYFQPKSKHGTASDTIALSTPFEPTIQPNDILGIQVASINPAAASFFNPSSADNLANEQLSSYLVDVNGQIEIPLVGKVTVAGMTTKDIRDTLRIKLDKYLQSPTVRVEFKNFKVTILGELRTPGVYTVPNEKVSVVDAIGLAGDLTIFGDRKKITVIRESNGKREFGTIDLTQRDVFASPWYYLHPGDVVYIPAGKGRIAAADTFYRIAPLVVSLLTLLTVVYIRISKN